MFLTLLIVTHTYIFFSRSSTIAHATASAPLECSPTAHRTRSFGTRLDARKFSMPDRSTSELLRTSLNEWLLLSQHPGCLCSLTSFDQLSLDLGTLAVGLGCFPLGHGSYHPCPHCRKACVWHSEFVWVWYPVKGPSPISALPPAHSIATLYLNTFRGVRAISEFDRPFTPTLRSSEPFLTDTGSVLHVVLPTLQPAQG